MTKFTWDHVQLRSRDPEAAAAWFARHLGARVKTGPNRIDIDLDGVAIFVSRAGAGIAEPPAHPHCGLDHVGLTVADLDAALAQLRAGGVELAEEVKTLRPGVRACYLLGPDDIWIELIERQAVS